MNSSVADHLLSWNHSVSYDNFVILMQKLKESLLILTDQPSLNRNSTSASLYLFDWY